jgi:hypothetical protein
MHMVLSNPKSLNFLSDSALANLAINHGVSLSRLDAELQDTVQVEHGRALRHDYLPFNLSSRVGHPQLHQFTSHILLQKVMLLIQSLQSICCKEYRSKLQTDLHLLDNKNLHFSNRVTLLYRAPCNSVMSVLLRDPHVLQQVGAASPTCRPYVAMCTQ